MFETVVAVLHLIPEDSQIGSAIDGCVDHWVFGALDPADQAFLDETVHGDADRTWGEIADRTYRIDRQRPLWSSTYSTPKSESPSPVPSIPAAAQRVNARLLLNTVGHKIPESSRSIHHQLY